MNAEEYLEQVAVQNKRVKRMREKLRMLREALGIKGVSYESIGAGKGSPNPGRIEEAYDKVIAYEQEVKEAEAQLAILRYDVEQLIQNLTDDTEREALEREFLMFQSIKQICEEMFYSKSRLYKIRRNALEKIVVPVVQD